MRKTSLLLRIAELEHNSAAQAAVIRTYQQSRLQLTIGGQVLFDNDLLTALLGAKLTREGSADLLGGSDENALGVVLVVGGQGLLTFAEADEEVL